MSTLDKLREAQRNRCKTVNVCGVEVVLSPLTAADGMRIQKQFAHIAGLTADDPQLLGFYIELVALSAVEPGTTTKALDSDEGRAALAALSLGEQLELGVAAAEINGFAGSTTDDAKKN